MAGNQSAEQMKTGATIPWPNGGGDRFYDSINRNKRVELEEYFKESDRSGKSLNAFSVLSLSLYYINIITYTYVTIYMIQTMSSS